MASLLYHRVVRFVHVERLNLLGWPTARQRGVWWLYEFHAMEKWRDLALKLGLTIDAAQDWLRGVTVDGEEWRNRI